MSERDADSSGPAWCTSRSIATRAVVRICRRPSAAPVCCQQCFASGPASRPPARRVTTPFGCWSSLSVRSLRLRSARCTSKPGGRCRRSFSSGLGREESEGTEKSSPRRHGGTGLRGENRVASSILAGWPSLRARKRASDQPETKRFAFCNSSVFSVPPVTPR